MLDNIDNSLKQFFQKDVLFTLKNKQYKKGKLINFKIAGCYLSFVVHTEKKKETFEIPFPFVVISSPTKIIFDYQLNTLAEQDFDLLINLKATNQVKNCKFYNAILTITPLN